MVTYTDCSNAEQARNLTHPSRKAQQSFVVTQRQCSRSPTPPIKRTILYIDHLPTVVVEHANKTGRAVPKYHPATSEQSQRAWVNQRERSAGIERDQFKLKHRLVSPEKWAVALILSSFDVFKATRANKSGAISARVCVCNPLRCAHGIAISSKGNRTRTRDPTDCDLPLGRAYLYAAQQVPHAYIVTHTKRPERRTCRCRVASELANLRRNRSPRRNVQRRTSG